MGTSEICDSLVSRTSGKFPEISSPASDLGAGGSAEKAASRFRLQVYLLMHRVAMLCLQLQL